MSQESQPGVFGATSWDSHGRYGGDKGNAASSSPPSLSPAPSTAIFPRSAGQPPRCLAGHGGCSQVPTVLTFPGAQIQGLTLWRAGGSSHPSSWPGLLCKQSNPLQILLLGWGGTLVTSYLNKAGVNTTGFNWPREESTDLVLKTRSFHPVLYLHPQAHSGLGPAVLMGHQTLGCSCSSEVIC